MELEFTIRCSANIRRTEIDCDDKFDISDDELIKFITDCVSVDFDGCSYLEYYIEDAYGM